jgi:hypothetical protein
MAPRDSEDNRHGSFTRGAAMVAAQIAHSSLQINEDGSRIVLPGATREQVKGLPEFKYR